MNLVIAHQLFNCKISLMKRILSGVQPTGNMHLGNYLGSIKNWLTLQDGNDCLFGIMNLHAITVKQNPLELRQNTLDAAALYLACGLDPKKSNIFVQSQISQHVELSWIFSTITPLGWLNRMTQFKDKAIGDGNLGLYAYPVLMAADILLYKTDLVPVGEDQKQHLELARDLAGAFNRLYNTEFFKLPEPLIVKEVARIMSLQDGNKKMSKSDESDLSRINLNDNTDLIIKKIKKAKTDSLEFISYDENRPEICNLLDIFASLVKKDVLEVANQYHDSGFGKFKSDLAEILVQNIQPIQKKFNDLKADYSYVQTILDEGNNKAINIASQTMKEVKQIIGF